MLPGLHHGSAVALLCAIAGLGLTLAGVAGAAMPASSGRGVAAQNHAPSGASGGIAAQSRALPGASGGIIEQHRGLPGASGEIIEQYRVLPGASGGITAHRPARAGVYGGLPSPALWCVGHRLGDLSAEARHSGQNLARLQAAQAELAPGFDAGTATGSFDVLVAYQEELEKVHPNRAIAASYLALSSTVPITVARLRDVNALLCVSTTEATARAITEEAETERLQMFQ